ncbi:MAG: hypothetical protein V4671_26400, partial [Armatimonadota bacterium]
MRACLNRIIATALFSLTLLASGRTLQAADPAPAQGGAAAVPVHALTPVLQVTHPPVEEMSGIVKSVRYPNVFWIHNDSGDEPRLFAIRTDGSVIMPSWLGGSYYTGPIPVEGKKPYPGVRIAVADNS